MERRLTAVLAVDVVGYSRMMAEDEAATLEALKRHRREIFDPEVRSHGGRIVKLMGDGALAAFPSATGAVEAAFAVQKRIAENPGPVRLRIGVNLGDVIVEGTDIYGDGVNVAARLEALAPAGGICISALVRDCLGANLAAEFTDAGAHTVKNMARPITVYSWPSGASLAPGEEIDLIAREPASVAVQPFDDMTGETGYSHLPAGLHEDLTAILSKLDDLRLVSVPAASAGPGAAARLGRELGVAWLVRGAVRAAGPHVRVNVQLIDCGADRTVWAERFDGRFDDIFAFQDRVVDEIAATLQVSLSDGEQAAVWRNEADDVQAYAHFLGGRASYKEYNRAANMRARDLYEKAIARSPRFAAAIVGLARTHIEDASFGWTDDRSASLAEARALLDRAFAIDPDHGLASAEMAHLLMIEGAFEEALEFALRATRLAPALGDAYHVCATVLVCLGRCEDALHYSREALRRTPAAPEFYLVAMAEAYLGLNQFTQCLAVARRIMKRRPEWLTARTLAAISLCALGRREEAQQAVERIRDMNPRFTAARWRRMLFYGSRPDLAELEAMLVEAGLPS